MSINFKDALGVHGDAMQVREQRTRVLATNIANENTPGFQAQDMDFAAVMEQMANTTQGGVTLETGDPDALYRVPYHPSRDGNTVEIGVEQAAFSQNASDFQVSLTFTNMKLRGLAKAIAGQ